MIKKRRMSITALAIIIGSVFFSLNINAQELNSDIRSDGMHYWNQADFSDNEVLVDYHSGVNYDMVELEARVLEARFTRYTQDRERNILSAVLSFETSRDAYNYTLSAGEPDASGSIPKVKCNVFTMAGSDESAGGKCMAACRYEGSGSHEQKTKYGTYDENGVCQ